MRRVTFRGWSAEVDCEATRAAYAAIDRGAPEVCGCAECLNFLAVLRAGDVFPPEVLTLLDELCVDVRRPAEVHSCGPAEANQHRYAGWFNVVGRLIEDREDNTEIGSGTVIFPMADGQLVPSSFPAAPIFRIEFEWVVPWLLSTPSTT